MVAAQYNVQIAEAANVSANAPNTAGAGVSAGATNASLLAPVTSTIFGISKGVFISLSIIVGVVTVGVVVPLSVELTKDSDPSSVSSLSNAFDATKIRTEDVEFSTPFPRCLDDEFNSDGTCDRDCPEKFTYSIDNSKCYPICPPGFHNNDEGYCRQNICTCHFGVVAEAENCTIHLNEVCNECEVTHYLTADKKCKLNRCSCKNGIGTSPCPSHNFESCFDCNENYLRIPTLDGNFKCSIEPSLCKVNQMVIDGDCVDNICSCPNGVPLVPCLLPNLNECSSCNNGYTISTDKKSCIPNICDCENGFGATDGDCFNPADNKCSSCQIGYHLENYKCVPNECICQGGTVSKTKVCTIQGSQNCGECDEYHKSDPINNDYCIKKVCICEFGEPDINCNEDGEENCSSCFPDYFLTNDGEHNHCGQNECSCNHGVYDTLWCHEDGSQSCKSCNKFYHLTDDHNCARNKCHCQNSRNETIGQVVDNRVCLENNGRQCEFCSHDGYKFANQTCVEKVCTCENGTGLSDGYCLDESEIECVSCNEFYHEVETEVANSGNNQDQNTMIQTTCRANDCYCNNGIEKPTGSCPTHRTESCQSCNFGYRLIGDRCIINTCTDCQNGRNVAIGTCRIHDRPFCRSCDNYYHLVDGEDDPNRDLCIKNVCDCKFGQTTENCRVDGGDECVIDSCFPGHTWNMTTTACEPNVCYCPNGQGVMGLACRDDNDWDCESCNYGYTKIINTVRIDGNTHKCQENICTCQINNTVVGTRKQNGNCQVSGLNDCEFCNDFYHIVKVNQTHNNKIIELDQCEKNQCQCDKGSLQKCS